MSHVPPTSNQTSKPLDRQVIEFTEGVLANPSPRGLAMAIEANQRLLEYLDELKDAELTSSGVTVMVDGESVHFQNEEDFSDWLSENMQ